MENQILFIQGGGEGGYEADRALVNSLQATLGDRFEIHYPEILADESKPDFGWCDQIGQQISRFNPGLILVAHSFGASMLLKWLSEQEVDPSVRGIFLMATSYWDGNEKWQTGLKLREDFAGRLPRQVPIYFYHCQDDEEVALSHMHAYNDKLPGAIFREIPAGGHQFNNDLSVVSTDIEHLLFGSK